MTDVTNLFLPHNLNKNDEMHLHYLFKRGYKNHSESVKLNRQIFFAEIKGREKMSRAFNKNTTKLDYADIIYYTHWHTDH